MAVDVILPRVDMDMVTAKISRWLADDGATVRQGDPLFEIETDKAAMEIEAAADGVLRVLPGARIGEDVPIGSVVATILQPGEEAPSPAPPPPPASATTNSAAPTSPASARTAEVAAGPAPVVQAPVAEELRATPLARRLAREMQINLATVRGQGPRGRITADDVRAAPLLITADEVRAAPFPAPPAATCQPRADSGAGQRGMLHTLRSGQPGAVPVMFLHGFGSEAAVWRSLWGLHGSGRALLAPDLPGHGKSAGSGEATMEALVEAVLQVLHRERADAVHLVGHSLGGAVAARIAARGLADVRSLLLLAPAGLGPEIDGGFLQGFLRARQEASLQPWVERLFADPSHVRQGLLRSVLDAHSDPACLAFRERLAASLFPDGTQSQALHAELGALQAPCRIVWGRQDAIIPYRHALTAPGRIGLHLFDGIGHMPHVEAPGAIARIHFDLMASSETE